MIKIVFLYLVQKGNKKPKPIKTIIAVKSGATSLICIKSVIYWFHVYQNSLYLENI